MTNVIRIPFLLYKKVSVLRNKRGNKKKCYICGNRFNSFLKYKDGYKNYPEFRKKLKIVGSDLNNFSCIYCKSNDRERHLFMYFDKLNLWDIITNGKVLHFAPENHLADKIKNLNPPLYVKADLFPNSEEIEKIDITKIPYEDKSFDIVICNHVLEHVPDYKKALSEIYRVLKPSGKAVLQTPYSELLKEHFEDENINTDELRDFFYGQKDHVRIYSKQELLKDLQNTSFKLNVIKHSELFSISDSDYYGVNQLEDLLCIEK
jgi:SAM-dependent methyltransferase